MNLAKTTPQWETQFRKMGRMISVWRFNDELVNRFTSRRLQVLEEFDDEEKFSAWDFTFEFGVNPNGSTPNIHEAGKLWVKAQLDTPSPGDYQINLYLDSGLSTSVAQGTGTAGTTIAFAGNKGVSGSVATVSGLSATTSGIILTLFPDFPCNAQNEFDDSTAGIQTSQSFLNSVARHRTRALAMESEAVQQFNRYANGELKEFLQSAETSVIVHEEEVDADGAITLKTRGIIADLKDAMSDNTATAQTILQSTVSASAAVFDVDNQGSGSMVLSASQGLLDGEITFRCTDQTIGRELFEVSIRRSDNNRTLTARNSLTIKQAFRSSDMRITATLSRAITDSGTAAASFSAWSFTGENDTNTNDGVVFDKVTISGGFIILQVYSASTRASGVLVSSGSVATGAGSTGITLTSKKGSGLNGSVTVDRGTVAASTTLATDFNVFKIDDKIYSTATNDFAGKFSEFFARKYNFELGVSATPTQTDDFVLFAGLPEYANA